MVLLSSYLLVLFVCVYVRVFRMCVVHSSQMLVCFCSVRYVYFSFLLLLFECMKDWKRETVRNWNYKEVDRLKVLVALRASFFFHLVFIMIVCSNFCVLTIGMILRHSKKE